MFMATKFVWFVTYSDQLPPMNSYDPSVSWAFEVTWQIKYVIPPLAKQKFHGQQTKQVANLPWEASSLKATWLFDHVNNMRTLEKFISPLSQDLWSLKLAGYWLQGRGSLRKYLSSQQPLVPFGLTFLQKANFSLTVPGHRIKLNPAALMISGLIDQNR